MRLAASDCCHLRRDALFRRGCITRRILIPDGMYAQEAAGMETPVLRIVSLQADRTNRGHAFDMDLSDLLLEGRPLPYAQAREYFRSDPSQRSPPPTPDIQ
jgi:hypothetical protein